MSRTIQIGGADVCHSVRPCACQAQQICWEILIIPDLQDLTHLDIPPLAVLCASWNNIPFAQSS